MNQANTKQTFAAMREGCRTSAKEGSQQREPVPSNNESYKGIYSYSDIRIPEREIETEVSRGFKGRRKGRFLKGPIPMPLISTAAKRPGQSLALYLAIHHQTALTGKQLVTLPSSLLIEMGINKDAKARGLRQLENAGLIRVERVRGRSVRVSLNIPNAEAV